MKNVFLSFFFLYLVYDANFGYSQSNPLLCGMRDDSLSVEVRETLRKLPSIMAARSQKAGAAGMRICRLAIDIDSYTWQQSGYDSVALIKTLHETINTCSAHFEEQVSIRLVISQVTIFKDPLTDPYRNAMGAYSYYLALLALPPPPVPFDKRIVLFTKPSYDYAGWGPYGEKLSSATLGSVPVIMHELGHSFGSPHTHSCDWPGGPIDYCSPLEGGPCYDGSMEFRSRPASLMSYCDLVTDIHPLCRIVMEEHAAKNFQSITSAPSATALPQRAMISRSLYIPWPASHEALEYEVMYADSENFQGGQTAETRVNGIWLQKLNAGKRFYLKVRGKNEYGVSAWSNPMLVDVTDSILQRPALRKPDHKAIVNGPQRLEFDSVPGATAYEIHVTTAADVGFAGFVKEIVKTTFFDFQPFFDAFRWRVRAMFGDVPGPWSEERMFSQNASQGSGLRLPFDPVTDTTPLSFPFLYNPPRFNTVVSITISEKPDMADPLFQKTYQQTSNQFSDWISGLPANRQLYFRIRETNPGSERLPEGLLVDFTLGFSTGTVRPDPRIDFITRYAPAVFGKNPVNLALSDNHVWFRSLNTGYIQLSAKDLHYQVHHRDNTNGLIGVSRWDASVHGDRKGNISFLNDGINGSLRVIRLGGETVSQTATVEKFVTLRSFFGFSPDGNICWNNRQISQLRKDELDHVLFEASGNSFIFDVRVDGDMIRFIYVNNDEQRNEIVTIGSDGTVLQRYYSRQNNSLKDQFRQIAADSKGEVWVRQEALDGSTSVVAIKGDHYRLFEAKDIVAPGQRFTSLFVSPVDQVYIMATGNFTQIYRLEEPGNWRKIGPELPYPTLGDQLWVDRLENFWLSTMYGLVLVKSGDPVLSVDPELETTLKLFPNPSSEKLVIAYAKAGEQPCRFYITDLLGRTVGSYLVTGEQSEIDIRLLQPGIYIVRTEAGDRRATGRFIKK